MSDLLEFAGVSELSDTWGTLKEFEYLQDIPLTNLEFWWRADKITNASNGDAIETLTNEAGTGNPTQGTLAARAIYRTNQINGMPALDFDGVNDYYIVNGPQAAFSGDDLPFTFYAVYAADVTNADITVVCLGRSATTNSRLSFGHISTGVYRTEKLADAGGIAARNVDTTKTYGVLRVNTSSGTNIGNWENETDFGSFTFDVGTSTVNRFLIGAELFGATPVVQEYFNGKVAEVLLYSANHNDATRLLISRYLKNKYRLYL
jgi:hypothetical protein